MLAMRNLAFVSRRYIRVEVGMLINKSIHWLGRVCVYGEVIHTQHITHIYILCCGCGMDFARHNAKREKSHWVAAINKNVSLRRLFAKEDYNESIYQLNSFFNNFELVRCVHAEDEKKL